ncbi:hypothetical protein ACT3CD_16865 [Geofilum sp. OHC36d9]|uniref:hypothetical protein n=1 Tax=Geofilum sp. OHC36d9 TaxID=3458413 RepID=UPI0040341A94
MKPTKWIDGSVDEIVETLENVDFLTKEGNIVEGYVQVVKKGDEIGFRLAQFTEEQIAKYVQLATKPGKEAKVMLGKYKVPNTKSYIERAGKTHTYFDLGDKWNDIKKLVNGSDDEMWRINKQFIDNQKALNKEFYFSHEPWKAGTKEFLSREAEYLIDLGAKDFQKIGDDLWKVIW